MTVSPILIDLILGGIAAEFIFLALFLRKSGAVSWVTPLLWFLASGALLMTAIRMALTGQHGALLALPLLLSLLTHMATLISAWIRIKKARS